MTATPSSMTATPSPVVVTGANGFIGRLLVPVLEQRGYSVRAISRTSARDDWRPPLEPTAEAWAPLVAGAVAVVHLAAMAHEPPPGRDGRRVLRATNVLMTEAVARAAAEAGVATFVFMSSIKAVAARGDRSAIAESQRPAPADCYGLAKLAAERRLERIARTTAMRIVILRPPLVFGPGVKANFARLTLLARWSARGLPLPFARIRNLRSVLYAGNLISAVARVLDCRGIAPAASTEPGSAGGVRRYHLADEPPLSTPDLIARMASAVGGSARLVPIPWLWVTRAARILRRSAEVERLAESLVVDSRRFRQEFAWTPELSLDEGLVATLGPRT
jgi:nucleoside-diphosphate-sugar epimerase